MKYDISQEATRADSRDQHVQPPEAAKSEKFNNLKFKN